MANENSATGSRAAGARGDTYGGGSSSSSNSGGGGLGGPSGSNNSRTPYTNQNGVPVNPATPKKLPSIPDHVPDTNGGATPPQPVDLSLLAGPQDLPQRKPLVNASVPVPQTGVTGYAGVFIP